MKHLKFSRAFAWLALGACAVVLCGSLVVASVLGLADASSEQGPIEWSQEIFLLVAVVFSVGAMVGLRGSERLAAFLGAILYAVFFFRELELPETGPVTRYLASDAFRWHEVAAVILLTLPYLAARRQAAREIAAYAFSLRVWPFALGVVLLATGAAFDGVPFIGGIPHLPTFFEETAETMGYGVLAVAAGWVLVRSRQEEDAAPELSILSRRGA